LLSTPTTHPRTDPHLQGVSLLPRAPKAAYRQLPYEAISADEYGALVAGLRKVDFSHLQGEQPTAPDKFCDSSRCDLEHPVGVSTAANQAPESTGREGAAVSRRNMPSDVQG
jgi:hypothetical protein